MVENKVMIKEIMMKFIENMNSNDLYPLDLFLLNKTMFFVQKLIIIIFVSQSGRNKDSRLMSISDNPSTSPCIDTNLLQ